MSASSINPGEFALAGTVTQASIVMGQTDPMHVRIDIDASGSKVYKHTKAGRSPHLVVNPPEREQ